MSADLSAVPPPVEETIPDPVEATVPLIESDPDGDLLAPFQVAYRLGGERVVETFQARQRPPFAIFRRLADLERASSGTTTPKAINDATARLLRVALTDESTDRLMALIEGDEEQVGVITAEAIGGVVAFLRGLHYASSPTQPGSSNGGSRTSNGSSAGRSGRKSTSKSSARKKA